MKKDFQPNRILGPILLFAAGLWFRPKIYNEEGKRIRRAVLDSPSLIISNHVSHPDGVLLAYAFRKYTIHPLAAKDRFEQGGLMEWFLKTFGCIPIDRENSSTEWMHSSIKVIKEYGESVAIYPEGRHGHNGEILPFHAGGTMLAAFTGVPLVYVYVDGKFGFFKRCRMIVSNPVTMPAPTDGLNAEYFETQTGAQREKILEMQRIAKKCA